MKKPRICVTIVENNIEAVKEIEQEIDLFEVRIDLIGPDWPEMVKFIKKPWIACNRSQEEGGVGNPNRVKRIEELLWAAEAGACIVDLEHRTPNLAEVVPIIKSRAKCMLSYHDMIETPSFDTLVRIAESQIKAGADICKIVTTAHSFGDNTVILKLIERFPEIPMVAFAMGESGRVSRVLAPLVGGYYTYACIEVGKEAASGQIPAGQLLEIYGMLRNK